MTRLTQADLRGCAADASRLAGIPVTCTGSASFGARLVVARFCLANGLRVVLAPDDQAPVFAYQTWFGVGSKHEDPQQTGLAHLFEHLMFKGTHRFPTGTFDREMERRGAQTNAATWVDWTYYTQAMAARGDNLATLIGFESDRMHNLVLDAATFQSELEVVKNERRMAVEDNVAGMLDEALAALAYTAHPYRWPTLGSMAHLEAVDLAALRAFYRRHYVPNNATLVLVGALEPVDTLMQLARAYGPLEARPLAPASWPVEPAQPAQRQRQIACDVLSAQLLVGYHAPAQGDPDYPALELLAEILVGGDSARLYQDLVVSLQLASDVDGGAAPFAEPGLFQFDLQLRPGVSARAALAALQAALDRLGAELVPAELDKARCQLELSMFEGLRDVEGRAEALGHHETNAGDFSLGLTQMAAYGQATLADLRRVAAAVFALHRRNVVLGHPAGEASL